MLPVHLGHIFCIQYAAQLCQQLHVLLFHSSPHEKILITQSTFPHFFLQPHIRETILRTEFQNKKNIFIHSINATECVSHSSMTANENFQNKEFIITLIQKNPDAIFSSEPPYSNFFSQLYPQAQHILVDPERKNFNISGTSIRKLNFENAKHLLPKSYLYIHETL